MQRASFVALSGVLRKNFPAMLSPGVPFVTKVVNEEERILEHNEGYAESLRVIVRESVFLFFVDRPARRFAEVNSSLFCYPWRRLTRRPVALKLLQRPAISSKTLSGELILQLLQDSAVKMSIFSLLSIFFLSALVCVLF